MRAGLVAVLSVTLAGALPACTPAVPAGRSVSIGSASHGFFRGPVALPPRGPGYRFVRDPAASYGTARMVSFLQRAASKLEQTAGPGPDLRIGDLSIEGGGRIQGHGSHRAGRDADVLYFARDAGNRLADVGAMRFDRFGRGTLDGARYQFDTRRNWALVRAMLTDPEIEVQWIFCSHGLKVLLLEEALAQGEDIELVRRAAWILHRPTNARPHDDHLHVRIYCSAEERSLGCIDGAPQWDWRPTHDDALAGGPTDPEILAALAPDPEASARAEAASR